MSLSAAPTTPSGRGPITTDGYRGRRSAVYSVVTTCSLWVHKPGGIRAALSPFFLAFTFSMVFPRDYYLSGILCARNPPSDRYRRQETGALPPLCCVRSHSATRRADSERRTSAARRAAQVCGDIRGGVQLLPRPQTARRVLFANVCA